MMLGQKPPVDIRILVHADRDDRNIRHLPLQRQQAGQLFDARSAIGGPKIQHNDPSAQLAQVRCPDTIAQNELRRRLIDVSRVTSPIAPSYRQYSQHQNLPRLDAQYTPLPIIRSRDRYEPRAGPKSVGTARAARSRTLGNHSCPQRGTFVAGLPRLAASPIRTRLRPRPSSGS